MDSKANILYSNVGSDEAKFSLSYFITDCGSMATAEKIKDLLDNVVTDNGGTPKE